MAAVTTIHLLSDVRRACSGSAWVQHIEERIVDIDVLHVRVYLTPSNTFINVFFNLASDKKAFALVQAGKRIYGADNAKMGWHSHPFADPSQHIICPEVTFSEFLQSVEGYLSA